VSVIELGALWLAFDSRLKLEFDGAKITTDAGLLACRELDQRLGFTQSAAWKLVDVRTGKNTQHTMLALFRQGSRADGGCGSAWCARPHGDHGLTLGEHRRACKAPVKSPCYLRQRCYTQDDSPAFVKRTAVCLLGWLLVVL